MVLSLPRRETDLQIEQSDSRYIVHDRKHDYVHILDRRALEVLQECDGTHSCNDIAKTLSYRTHDSYDQVASEVAHLVAAFSDLALIESAATQT
ncbi:MAG TPA: hypothetical protein VJP85_15225 [Candidatus Baltobacteraceae bacterium]|nr:hypothetical protein [Candidatus Baltobacteraceae bacterium]